jgi:hypothetical protein
MALSKFKNIDDVLKKGTSLTTELSSIELKLIDKGFIPTPFDIGNNDVLEFLLYDSSNNVLEQKDYGNVRYIPSSEIQDYIIRSENIIDKVYDGGGFLIDVKRLVKEAGYNTGIFRVQFNFVNNRVGSNIEMDRMWIHQISPSRSELRLLPYNNFNETNPYEVDIMIDLNQAYSSFVNGKFSGDEVYSEIDEIINRLTVADLQTSFSKSKSKDYIDRIQYEFGIQNYDQFFTKILESMKESVRHTLLHKNAVIGGSEFGQPLGDEIDFTYYNKNDIINLLGKKFRESCEFHLPTRTLLEETVIDAATQQSIDNLSNLIQKLESDKVSENVKVERVSVSIPTYGEVKDAVTAIIKKEVIIPGVEEPIIIQTPVMDTPATDVSDVVNERGGFFGRLKGKKRTGFLGRDLNQNKISKFFGAKKAEGLTGGASPLGGIASDLGTERGGVPSSISGILRKNRIK